MTTSWDTAIADDNPAPVATPTLTDAALPASEQYFVDFRSRAGYLFGHTFIRYGRLDAHGKALDVQSAGIYPIQAQPGLIIGSVIPVAASVRRVDEDVKEAPTNIYRRKLTADQYARLKVAVRHLRATDHHWHLLFSNCNDFAIEVATALNMRTPSSWLPPASFVAALRAMNTH